MVRTVCSVVAAVLVGAVATDRAGAEVGASPYPTSQAIAADAQFLEYAPPPAQPGVVCLVDSGVDLNPDTVGALVGAEAEIPSWGTGDALAQSEPLVEGHPAGHGTEMAMLMAAPENGWGMVGIAPTSVRVYSIRVVPAGGTLFPFSAYTYAINRCLKRHTTSGPPVEVINLSLAGPAAPSSQDLGFLTDSVETARLHGVNVVGAAGNDGLASVSYPAAYASVFAVGAGDTAAGTLGVLCDFSNTGGLDVVAPGCNSVTGGIDEAFEDDGTAAFGFGTSQASALASAVLASMRAYEPALGVAEAELCVTRSEQPGGSLDVSRAFYACGLGSVVQAGLAAIPPPASDTAKSVPPSPAKSPASGGMSTPLPRPRLGRIRLRHGVLAIKVLNRPRGTSVEIELLVTHHGRRKVIAHRVTSSNATTFAVRRADHVKVRFVTVAGEIRTSVWIVKVVS